MRLALLLLATAALAAEPVTIRGEFLGEKDRREADGSWSIRLRDHHVDMGGSRVPREPDMRGGVPVFVEGDVVEVRGLPRGPRVIEAYGPSCHVRPWCSSDPAELARRLAAAPEDVRWIALCATRLSRQGAPLVPAVLAAAANKDAWTRHAALRAALSCGMPDTALAQLVALADPADAQPLRDAFARGREMFEVTLAAAIRHLEPPPVQGPKRPLIQIAPKVR